jgi:hypothetical protein
MSRPLIVTTLTTAVIGIVLSMANASTSRPVRAVQHHAPKPLHDGGSGCQTEADGEVVQLQVGESIASGKTWRTCQLYDGHPVIIFSSDPPKVAPT